MNVLQARILKTGSKGKIQLMKILLSIITLFVLLGTQSSADWSLDLESGLVSCGYNDVQIPGGLGTKVSLTDALSVQSKEYYRVRATKALSSDKYISVLYSPLTLVASGVLATGVNYNGDSFAAGASINAKYRFDSYRVTYYKIFNAGKRYSYKLGFTAKIRDAAILLSDGNKYSEKKNTGFVPLLNFGVNYDFTPKLALVVDGDALAGGPGRAEDVLIALGYKAGRDHTLRLGYRFVEGGADTKEVYSFALLNYISVAVILNF